MTEHKPIIVHADLLAAIERHRKASGESETAFGMNAVKDPNLIRDLKNGREMRMKTIRRIHEHMSSPSSDAAQSERAG